jgi:hypothetical protein
VSTSTTCPVCGGANPPDSRICSRCGTQLDRIVGGVAATPAATPPGLPTLPAPPGEPVTITHRGNTYAVGYGETFYGLWSLSGGPPLQRFERSDAGWQQAWARFQQLEAPQGG